jgi:putative MFS transporter
MGAARETGDDGLVLSERLQVVSGAATGPAPSETPLEIAVSERIDALVSWRHRLLPPILLGTVMLFDSFDAVVLAQIIPSLIREWQIGPVIAGSLISVGYAGQFCGALAIGPLAERYGRMPVLHVTLALMSVFAVLCATAPGYGVLMAFRFAQGMAIGAALPIAVTYINEIAPAAIRGRYFTVFKVLTDAGYPLAPLIGVLVIPTFGWRWMFVLGALPLLFLPLIAFLLPESPRWLARRGRLDDANRALAKLGAPHARIDVSETAAVATIAPADRISPFTLFAAAYRRNTITVMLLWLLSSIVVFGVVNWATTIHTTIYHLPHEVALRYVATSGVIYMIVAPIIGALSDKLGRRRLGLFCAGLAACALLMLAIGNPAGPLVAAILLHLGGKSLGTMGSMILWPYSAETSPTPIRATALGFYSAVNRLPPMFIPILIGTVLSLTGSIVPVFALFAVCAVAIVLIWVFFTRETSGRSLEEIERH